MDAIFHRPGAQPCPWVGLGRRGRWSQRAAPAPPGRARQPVLSLPVLPPRQGADGPRDELCIPPAMAPGSRHEGAAAAPGSVLPDRRKAVCQQHKDSLLPLPARPVLPSQKSERRQQNVDFYQLFALAPCFALFIIGIKLLLALGADSKTLSKGTRLHKPPGHPSNCSLSGHVSPEGKRYRKAIYFRQKSAA